MRKIDKPWGYELIWAQTDKYVGKILHINHGCSLSRQYHKIKDETVMVQSGVLVLEMEVNNARTDLILLQGQSHHILPGAIHRMSAFNGDVEVVEVSTPELDDVVRLEDNYGRT